MVEAIHFPQIQSLYEYKLILILNQDIVIGFRNEVHTSLYPVN